MPFTPTHIAAILPFVRSPLAPAALVIGSMMPDLPYFLPLGIPRGLTHSIPGIPLADLPMGIIVLALWALVFWAPIFRAPIFDFAPEWVRARFRPPEGPIRRPSFRLVAVTLASLLAGIVTHLVWDSFTHPDGWMVLHLAALRAPLGPFTAYRWVQYASSIGGLVILAIWAAGWVRRTSPAEQHPCSPARPRSRSHAPGCLPWSPASGGTSCLRSSSLRRNAAPRRPCRAVRHSHRGSARRRCCGAVARCARHAAGTP